MPLQLLFKKTENQRHALIITKLGSSVAGSLQHLKGRPQSGLVISLSEQPPLHDAVRGVLTPNQQDNGRIVGCYVRRGTGERGQGELLGWLPAEELVKRTGGLVPAPRISHGGEMKICGTVHPEGRLHPA